LLVDFATLQQFILRLREHGLAGRHVVQLKQLVPIARGRQQEGVVGLADEILGAIFALPDAIRDGLLLGLGEARHQPGIVLHAARRGPIDRPIHSQVDLP
jgi:hypothetical protein